MDYNQLASQESVQKTVKALGGKGYIVDVVKTGKDALTKIQQYIPSGASVMNGSSTTLEQIGFVDFLKSGKHSWENLHEAIVKEEDKEKQATLRKQALLSDYYVGSVHVLLETGEFLIASNSGSQLPHIVYSSPNLIFVVSTKKIVSSMDAAMKRLEEHVIPLEDARMKKEYGVGTALNKLLMFRGESAFGKRVIRLLLVEEDLGF